MSFPFRAGPVYVSPFAGAAADWLCLLDPSLSPLVSWMGGKRRLAVRLLHLLGLDPGQGVPAVLGDASWWGWVWPLCLDPVTGPQVAGWLRSWQGEDPRALWFRLRDAGPPDDLVERAAGLLWLQARAASGVPVWWEGDEFGGSRPGYNTGQRARDLRRLLQHASTQVDDAGQRQAREPCLLASDGRGVTRESGQKADKSGEGRYARTGGMVNPATIADRIDAVRARLVKASGGDAAPGRQDGWCAARGWRVLQPHDVADRVDAVRLRSPAVVIEHRDAFDLVTEWAPRLGRRGRIYLDPPYQGATGYPAECPRDKVLVIAETAARHGGRVVLSEAEALAGELGAGWRSTCLRRGRKPEWVTTYGCLDGAELGPLFARATA